MDSSELLHFLVRASEALGCVEVALRCDCENLETVYVVERAGQLVVTDRGDTFSDLERFNETYRQLDVEEPETSVSVTASRSMITTLSCTHVSGADHR